MCYADPETWDRVYGELTTLLSRAEALRNRLTKGMINIKKQVDNIIRQIEILIEDLEVWDPYESVCYDEFFSRIRTYKKRLEYLEKRY